MGVRIYKKLSKSTGTRRLESLFWFEKSSYEEYIAICDFSEVLIEGSVIKNDVVAILDNVGTNVSDSILLSTEIISKDMSVNVVLQGGSVSAAPYTCVCRVSTDQPEKSELEFEMRISYDSISIPGESEFLDDDDFLDDDQFLDG